MLDNGTKYLYAVALNSVFFVSIFHKALDLPGYWERVECHLTIITIIHHFVLQYRVIYQGSFSLPSKYINEAAKVRYKLNDSTLLILLGVIKS